ncbi:hypothetical protein ANANG_G00005430 [Anguilla anguilla]|uniref:PiggyBac transposable element-derived protein domain-containing protein n=1 Tax=Anguilla anguilla TaxID=7936 RepID=A0A9D3MZW6_ANGAN|nr:hypothetical protein ANANG_G00005430 [Anguilla anguilla]
MEVEGTEDQVRVPGNCQSPSILFERFFAGRQRDEGDMEQCQNELRNDSRLVNRTSLGFGLETGPQNRASGMALMGAVTGQVIKVEDFSSNLVPCQNGPSAAPARKRGAAVGQVQPYEQRGGVRVFLVKEENPLVLDEPQEFPGCGHAELPDEEMRLEGNICADSEAMLLDDREGGGDGEREGAVSASPLALDIGVPGGEQCIVFRVKEEEREVALDPPQREHGLSVLLVSRPAALDQQVDQGHTSADGPLVSDLHPGSFTDSDGIWVSVPPGCGAEEGAAENEECEQSRERLIQTGSQPDVFVCTGEGELNTEQQNTEELLEFLMQTSDVEYSDSSDSEPEEEAFAMACYHEGSSSGTGKLTSKNLERSRFSIPVVERPGGSVAEGNGGGGRKELTPVEYFSQYLDWETWEEIAHCTPTFSETPNSVTSKEVAQFVGIHIAMGTLKFPDKRLYWQDFTRVPLIADAMPASRFFLLAKKLRLARRAEDLETPGTEDTLQRIIPKNKESGEAIVFLCKEELCTPAVLERLLVGGVRSAGRVGGVRGGVGDEFVSSDGKLTLLRCQQGFILSTLTERQAHQFSLIKDFEGVQKDAQLHRDLLNLYRTPLTASSPARWPQSVLWHLADLALVNSWLQHRRDRGDSRESLSLMAFRLEVAKGLIHANGRSAPQSAPPHPPAPKLPSRGEAVSPAPRPALPLPDAAARYDGLGHWPEQVAEGEGARCRFGGCERTSRVRCLKCCVFLCISRNHNCFLKFHIQGSL